MERRQCRDPARLCPRAVRGRSPRPWSGRHGPAEHIAWVSLSVRLLFAGGLPVALAKQWGHALGAGRPGTARGLFAWAWWVQGIAAGIGGGVLVAVGLTRPGPSCVLRDHAFDPVQRSGRGADVAQAAAMGLTLGGLGAGATVAVLAAGGGITGIFAGRRRSVWSGWHGRRWRRAEPSRAWRPSKSIRGSFVGR